MRGQQVFLKKSPIAPRPFIRVILISSHDIQQQPGAEHGTDRLHLGRSNIGPLISFIVSRAHCSSARSLPRPKRVIYPEPPFPPKASSSGASLRRGAQMPRCRRAHALPRSPLDTAPCALNTFGARPSSSPSGQLRPVVKSRQKSGACTHRVPSQLHLSAPRPCASSSAATCAHQPHLRRETCLEPSRSVTVIETPVSS